MDNTETAAERGLPDLRERIDLMVGKLTVLAQSVRSFVTTDDEKGDAEAAADAKVIEDAMLLLAGLQEVVAWEPGDYRFTPQGSADQLRAMASIGPRPPAVVKLLLEAAGHLQIAQEARDEAAPVGDEELAALLLVAERDAYDLAEQSLAAGRRLAQLQARVASS